MIELMLKDLKFLFKKRKVLFLLAACFTLLCVIISFVFRNRLDINCFFIFYCTDLSCAFISTFLITDKEPIEQSQHSDSLPYNKMKVIISKCTVGLFATCIPLILVGMIQAVIFNFSETANINDFYIFMSVLLISALVTSSIDLLFAFKSFPQIVYETRGKETPISLFDPKLISIFITIIVYDRLFESDITFNAFFPIACLVAIAVYALSWYISIKFYKKHEAIEN